MSGKTWAERDVAALKELGSFNLIPILTERFRIGRDPSNNVVVSGDPCVSRFHSEITFEEGCYFIGDSGSWNGTIVNGEKVVVRRQIEHGDKIRVGLTRFEFVLGVLAESAADAMCAASDNLYSQTIVVGGRPGDSQETTHSLPESVKKPDCQPTCGGQDLISAAGADARIPVLPDVTVSVPQAIHDEIPHSAGPGWCELYFGSELIKLENDLLELKELASEVMQRIRGVGEKIVLTRDLRKALLLDAGDRPVFACVRIFEMMGWTAKVSDTDMCEVQLSLDGQIRAIAHISLSDHREALSRLVVSLIDHWCQHHLEPKGILILIAPGKDPQHHDHGINSEELVSYAEQKNICLMTAVQLLSVYREIVLRHAHADSFRHGMMITSGSLTGLDLEPSSLSAEI